MTLRNAWLLSLLAGLLFPLAFAPFSLWWLALLLPAVPVFTWLGSTPRASARSGFAFGFGAFLAGTYWLYHSVHVLGGTPLWLAIVLMLGLVLIMALYFAAAAAAVSRYLRSAGVVLQVFGIAAIWTLADWLRGWVLSGFPWLSSGYSQIDSPLVGYAALGGVYTIGFVSMLCASALASSIRAGRRTRLLLAGFSAGLLALGAMLATFDWTQPAGKHMRVALIQGAVAQDRKWLREQREPTLQAYRELTLANLDSQLIVWPEVAVPAIRASVADYLVSLDRQLERAGVTLAYGILEYEAADDRYFNSLLLLGSDSGRYDKRHLVPFGEYFPVPSFVREWMRLMSLPASDMQPGSRDQAPLTVHGYAVATTICYEDAFAAEQQYLFPEAKLIINVSNDAWFGDSIAPHHHLDIARMRSRESGRWQLRATNTGITALIDPLGRVVDSAPQFEPAVVTGNVEPRSGLTPYLRTGNVPIVLLCLIVIGFGILRDRRVVSGR